MRTAIALPLLLLGGLVLSGCLDDTGSNGDANVAEASDGLDGEARNGTLHFTSERTLDAVAEQGDGRTPIGWSWLDWMQGTRAPTWSSAAFDEDVVLHGINVTVTYYAEAAMVFPDTLRPQFTMWFGTGAEGETPAFVDHAFQTGPAAMLVGETYTVTFPVRLPAGGLMVAQGEQIILPVASYYPDGLGLGAVGLVFAESSLTWDGVATDATTGTVPALDAQALSFDGQLAGGRCVAPANPEDAAHHRFTFDVSNETTAIDAHLDRVSGAGMGPDLDMFIQDADGDTIAYAAGSGTPERIAIRPNNLAAAAMGTWTLNVYNCQPQVSDYAAQLLISTATTP